jgi:hypothetical protein
MEHRGNNNNDKKDNIILQHLPGKTFISLGRNKNCMRHFASLLALPLLLSLSLFSLGMAGNHAAAQERIVGPSDTVRVVISDWDLNANPRGVDRYEEPEFVVFRTSRDEIDEVHPDIVETGPSTGLFEFSIQLETDERACRLDLLADPRFAAEGGSNPSVGACPGDTLLVQYEDNLGADGRSGLVEYVFEIRSWNPEFTTDKSTYFAGDRISVNIYDPDANRDPDVADTLHDLRVYSESDPAGRQFSAVETGRSTGVFRLTFTTSLETQGNSILVRDGNEEVTVQYTDEFPQDFTAFQEVKRFNFVMTIGAIPDNGSLALSQPATTSMESLGNSSQLAVGQQATLVTDVTSSFERNEVPFVAIMEVRDADGVTVSLGWQTGDVHPSSKIGVGMSWIPRDPGTYDIRTFLVSDLLSPVVLSPVSTSKVTVSN